MNRSPAFLTPIVSVAFASLVWLSSLAPALAATVTDTFPLTVTGTERCRNDPKFVEPIHVIINDHKTTTLTGDALNTGDLTAIQAIINTHGDNATVDAMTLHGRALVANKSHSIAQLALSGRDPGNDDHFMTLRGTAIFDKAGNLTKVTRTYVYQVLSDLGGGGRVEHRLLWEWHIRSAETALIQRQRWRWHADRGECTGQRERNFCCGKAGDGQSHWGGAAVAWAEVNPSTLGHAEVITVGFDTTTGQVLDVIFSKADGRVGTAWGCSAFLPSGCVGASVNRTAGTFTVVDTVLTDTTDSSLPPPITMNGTLIFTPF